jgi:long-chain acyl-CoA synthetase
VSIDTRLADLGYDSLMYTELGAALEAAGAAPPEDITGIQTVRDLVRLVGKRQGPPPSAQVRGRKEDDEAALEKKLTDIAIPESVQKAGRRFFGFGQRFAYEKVFKTEYQGQVNIPAHGRFLVAANHQSHLDMGLVKMALGDQGKNLVALAAKDYFFDSWRGAYFKNFTNLLPMERHGSMKESLRIAADAIQNGYILLIFPEGTRSTTGVMTDFKPSLGYLALTNKVDILPMYLAGTYDAWPKGQALPEPGAEIAAHIGPVLTYEYLRKRTEGMTKAESYRVASAIAEEAVKALRDGRKWRPDEPKAAAAGTNGNGEHHATTQPAKSRSKPKRTEIADE